MSTFWLDVTVLSPTLIIALFMSAMRDRWNARSDRQWFADHGYALVQEAEDDTPRVVNDPA